MKLIRQRHQLIAEIQFNAHDSGVPNMRVTNEAMVDKSVYNDRGIGTLGLVPPNGLIINAS
jgi:hypothetical protein